MSSYIDNFTQVTEGRCPSESKPGNRLLSTFHNLEPWKFNHFVPRSHFERVTRSSDCIYFFPASPLLRVPRDSRAD
jgi:hypothetical protein